MRLRLAVLVAMMATACSRDQSPFDMWDMRAGMPFERLDSIAIHDQQERFTCLPTYESYRQCVLEPRAIPSRMIAIVDSTNRVIMISFQPDAARMGTQEGASVVVETERLKRRWSLVAPMKTDSSQAPRQWSESWRSKDRKYTSRITWAGSIYPTEVATIDDEHARAYRKLRAAAETDSIVKEQQRAFGVEPRGGADQLQTVQSELERLLAAQDAHFARTHRYAAALAQLHFIPRDSISLTINDASASGFWATATHSSVRGRLCVIWAGAPPSSTQVRLGGSARLPVCNETNL